MLSDIAYDMQEYDSRLKAYENIFTRVHLSSTLENRSIISAKFTAKLMQYLSLAKFPESIVTEKSVFPFIKN